MDPAPVSEVRASRLSAFETKRKRPPTGASSLVHYKIMAEGVPAALANILIFRTKFLAIFRIFLNFIDEVMATGIDNGAQQAFRDEDQGANETWHL